ncbi:MAG: UDP-N-acetylglucosamine 1-carboxyvinyltransferase [Desulfobacca sp.]|nr:UDP-N-acetylglucosamine 1-carboxyvinyltransferase [Desulfobacca sp.]
MDKIRIKGGVPLKGQVTLSGAKNAALPIMSAAILADGWSTLSNLPALRDIQTEKKLLSFLGASFEEGSDGTLRISGSKVEGFEAPYDLVKTMRASILVLGPLVARFGRARVSLPGGCAIGARPINLHLAGLELMGARIELKHGYVEAKARQLRGAEIVFDTPTVTGTENLMMAASLAKGRTIIGNAAKEPEVVDLANFLKAMGARIEGAGTDIITIHGVSHLHPTQYQVMPDRIEAGTYMIAAGITRGEITLTGYDGSCLETAMMKLKEAGLEFSQKKSGLTIQGPRKVKSVSLTTRPYPGFPTDMQAQFMALMSIGQDTCLIKETIFENRFMHVSELRRMGADIEVSGNQALIKGVSRLLGAPVMATDLRASASLVLAGLAADGITEISRVYHLDRGYEGLEKKLLGLGARIERIKEVT